MLIDLTEVLSCDGNEQSYELKTGIESFESGAGRCALLEKEPLKLVLSNKGGRKLLTRGGALYTALIPCDRCLEEVEVPIHLDFTIETDMKAGDEKRVEDLDETGFISGNELDTEKLVSEELLLAWPVKVLCKEDCKGICRKCGRNLNLGDCGCDMHEPDPRMAAIADIFKNDK